MYLEKLAKKQNYWINYINKFTNNEEVSKEIVQRMYIKMHNVQKEVDDWYVLRTLKNIYFDYLKKENVTISLDTCYNIEDQTNTFEINDKQLQIINNFNKLDTKTKTYIKMSSENSLRQMGEDYNESYMNIYRTILKGRLKSIGNE